MLSTVVSWRQAAGARVNSRRNDSDEARCIDQLLSIMGASRPAGAEFVGAAVQLIPAPKIPYDVATVP